MGAVGSPVGPIGAPLGVPPPGENGSQGLTFGFWVATTILLGCLFRNSVSLCQVQTTWSRYLRDVNLSELVIVGTWYSVATIVTVAFFGLVVVAKVANAIIDHRPFKP